MFNLSIRPLTSLSLLILALSSPIQVTQKPYKRVEHSCVICSEQLTLAKFSQEITRSFRLCVVCLEGDVKFITFNHISTQHKTAVQFNTNLSLNKMITYFKLFLTVSSTISESNFFYVIIVRPRATPLTCSWFMYIMLYIIESVKCDTTMSLKTPRAHFDISRHIKSS